MRNEKSKRPKLVGNMPRCPDRLTDHGEGLKGPVKGPDIFVGQRVVVIRLSGPFLSPGRLTGVHLQIKRVKNTSMQFI